VVTAAGLWYDDHFNDRETVILEESCPMAEQSGDSMTSFENILYDLAPPRATITLNRPPLNILDVATIREINCAVEDVQTRSDVHLVRFTAAGEKAFSVGVDVKDHTPDKVGGMLREFHQIFHRLFELNTITMAIVKGHCLGGGCELVMMCDFVIAAEGAMFGQPEIHLACYPPVAAVYLPRLIGSKRAVDMLLTGASIPARQAEAIGLITRVVPQDQLDKAADGLSEQLLKASPAALKLTKQALRTGMIGDFSSALKRTEYIYLNDLIRTEDAQEGINAFLEKRPPVWKGQ
jgi:cyclohexa-1,5-dienecarbonyl-CoA hydratase